MSNWFYSKNGGQHGPISTPDLKALAANGTLSPEDKVWREGMKEWKNAGKVIGLFPSEKPAQSSSSPPPLSSVKAPTNFSRTNDLHDEKSQSLSGGEPETPSVGFLGKISLYSRQMQKALNDPNALQQIMDKTFASTDTKTSGKESAPKPEPSVELSQLLHNKSCLIGCSILLFCAVVPIALLFLFKDEGSKIASFNNDPPIPTVNATDLASFSDDPAPIRDACANGYLVFELKNFPCDMPDAKCNYYFTVNVKNKGTVISYCKFLDAKGKASFVDMNEILDKSFKNKKQGMMTITKQQWNYKYINSLQHEITWTLALENSEFDNIITESYNLYIDKDSNKSRWSKSRREYIKYNGITNEARQLYHGKVSDKVEQIAEGDLRVVRN